jgi:predicted RNA-binding protein Jag
VDDWEILAPTRLKVRVAIRLVNGTLTEMKLRQHPDQTLIGRIGRGFDFLGYVLTPVALGIATRAFERIVVNVHEFVGRPERMGLK